MATRRKRDLAHRFACKAVRRSVRTFKSFLPAEASLETKKTNRIGDDYSSSRLRSEFMRAMRRAVASYLHYLSPNRADVKPKFSKVRLWVKFRSQTSGLTRSVLATHLNHLLSVWQTHQITESRRSLRIEFAKALSQCGILTELKLVTICNADSTAANDRNGDVAVDTVRRKRFAKGDCGGVACVDATHEHKSIGHEAEVGSALSVSWTCEKCRRAHGSECEYRVQERRPIFCSRLFAPPGAEQMVAYARNGNSAQRLRICERTEKAVNSDE